MKPNELNLGMVGSGGDGVMAAGEIIVKASAREGLNCILLKSFGPQIRGGESACKIRITSRRCSVQADDLDILLVFNWADYRRFGSELTLMPLGVVIEDGEEGEPEPDRPVVGNPPHAIYRVPMSKIARETAGTLLARNMVAVGALCGLADLPEESHLESIRRLFEHKPEEIISANFKAFETGRDYVRQHIIRRDQIRLIRPAVKSAPRVVMTGNDSIAYGAMLAGCRFFAGYPITPSSEIMEWLSVFMPKFGGEMVQTEDEIAALGMVLGASLVGRKAMTATSGPGLSLMSELLGLASIAEIPCVVVDVQRAGPSTGIPTKSEQADLMQAVFGGHGDSPRVVMAPADVSDCLDVMREAFFVSEKYQMPVIVLSDGSIGLRKAAFAEPDISIVRQYERTHPPAGLDPAEYKRFLFTETGVSPMSIPGVDLPVYRAAGIEHNEKGAPTSEFEMHQRMNEKRYRKLGFIAEEVCFMRHYGPQDAPVGVLAWGSSKGAVREAVENLNEEGFPVKAVIPQVLFPLNAEKLKSLLGPLRKLLVVELSYSRQFLNLLKTQMDLPEGTVHYGRSGARPLGIHEIMDQVRKLF
jgi:2-oxoglutarate/2-oxoacid ferredoxin oxidoreductase subunit alpha